MLAARRSFPPVARRAAIPQAARRAAPLGDGPLTLGHMETLNFTTPTTRVREKQPVTVDFVGETITITRPKDWVLLSARTCLADNVTDSERALSLLQFLLGTLGQQGYSRFLSRALDRDDPINLTSVITLISKLLETWADYTDNAAVTVEPTDESGVISDEPVRIVNDDLGIDYVFHPPKDLIIMAVAATLSSPEDGAQQWACELFLDACLDRTDAVFLKRRLRISDDDNDLLDVDDIAPIMKTLLERWEPGQRAALNRAERRAQTKKPSTSGSRSGKPRAGA